MGQRVQEDLRREIRVAAAGGRRGLYASTADAPFVFGAAVNGRLRAQPWLLTDPPGFFPVAAAH
jgi:hypothetical protein